MLLVKEGVTGDIQLVQPVAIPSVDGLRAHQTDLPVGRSGGWPALLVMQGQVILELWE